MITMAAPGVYDVTLNAAGLAAFNAALGGSFAFGAALTSLSDGPNEYVGGMSTDQHPTDIVGETAVVPEPTSLFLLGTGVATLLGRTVQQQRRARRVS
jgi:hypothetical protein